MRARWTNRTAARAFHRWAATVRATVRDRGVVARCVLSVAPLLAADARTARPEDAFAEGCFEVLGARERGGVAASARR